MNQQKSKTYSIFGDLSVGEQRALIFVYFALALACLFSIEWSHFSFISFFIVLFLGVFAADFFSGLVHLYIDYRPLNYEKKFDLLYDYQGDRGSKEFIEMKSAIVSKANWFDHTVYSFKIHHRNAVSNLNFPYRDFFIQAAPICGILLFVSLFFSWVPPVHPWSSYLALFYVVLSVAAIHSDHIHVCAHGSTAMPLGAKVVRFLQKNKLIYSNKTHGLHHKDGLTGFCFVTGHANFAVNWICKKLLERGVINSDDWHGLPRSNNSVPQA